MGTSAQQATFAAQKGKAWADPTDANFGQNGYIGQDDYSQYSAANPGSAPAPPPGGASMGQPQMSTPEGVNGSSAAAAPSVPITTQNQAALSAAHVGGSNAPGTQATIAQSFQQALINRMNPGPLDASNPQISGAIEANKLAEQRGMERSRNIAAEQNARDNGGVSNGGFDTTLLGLSQDRAANEGQFAGNAVMNLGKQQSNELTSALGMGGNLLSEEERNALTEKLGGIDAQLRAQALAQQGQLGNSGLELQNKLGSGQLNLGLLSTLLGNQYNNAALGQNASQFGQTIDQQGLLGLLGLL